MYGIRVLRADKQRVCEGPKHILNIYKYNKTGSILKIEPFFCAFFHRKFVHHYKYVSSYLAFAKARTFTFQKFLKKFQENNPQLVVVGAYIHNDEATPHMHIDYVPVATYSKGLKTRVSNDKALNQMGYKTWNDWKDSQMACLENLVREKGYDREYMNNSNRHIANVEQFKRVQKEVERQANNKLEKMELPDIPEPEIKLNPITKTESVKFSKAEFEQIKQVINYQQIQITSLEAHKSDLSAKLEINKQTINRIKNKPYMRENETLTQNLQDESDFSEKLTKKYEKLNNQYIDLFKGYKKLEKEKNKGFFARLFGK